jgi:hypothetical protein
MRMCVIGGVLVVDGSSVAGVFIRDVDGRVQ